MLTTPTETPSGTTVPCAGTYAATLVNVRRFETFFGPRIGFELELTEGQPGVCVLVSAADVPNPRGKLAELIATLAGRPATEAERGGDLNGLVGARCHAQLAPALNRSGKAYLRVDRLMP